MYFLIMVKVIVDVIFENVEYNWFVGTVLGTLGAMMVLGFVGLVWNIRCKKNKSEAIVITYAKNITDQHFLSYFSIFILFALGFDMSRFAMFAVFAAITIFVGIVYIKNRLFYINPFLNILGFNFYEITYTKEGSSDEHNAKLFYRGDLKASGDTRQIRIKNTHFAFVDKPKHFR